MMMPLSRRAVDVRSRERRAAPLVAVAVLAASTLAWTAEPVETTIAADRFVDSVGVNVHLHYNGTLYREAFPLVERRLEELGVRHVRDGLVDTKWQPYFDRHNALGRAGIKGTFIVDPEQDVKVWIGYPARMKDSFEAYEAPNEYDLKSGRRDWADVLRKTLERMQALDDDPRVTKYPVYGPSLTSAAAFKALGDIPAFVDFANLHNYFAGRHPGTRGWGANGYGSIRWNLDLANRYARGKPVVTTETGYQDAPSIKGSAPPEVVGRYMPRLLLEQFRAGIVRTYLYELADFKGSGHYGLLNEDGAPKPAFTAVSGLLRLLDDPGPSFTPKGLACHVEDGPADLQQMAFEKRDGRVFVALWRARASYDPESRRVGAESSGRTTLVLPEGRRAVRLHRWQLDGSVKATAPDAATSRIDVEVGDRLTVVEVASSGASMPHTSGSVHGTGGHAS